MGKAIYNPGGPAAEYSKWACNLYVGQDKPQLKKCFRDEDHAFEVFQRELERNIFELQEYGLFFSFTTDPLLFETKELTMMAINDCLYNDIPVKILSKCTEYIDQFVYELQCTDYDLSKIAFGFTLTGHDELEPNASSNQERIEAMFNLHDAGFKTWASIEPIIDFPSSLDMFHTTYGFCDLYKIGLKSREIYKIANIRMFVNWILDDLNKNSYVYFKDSLLKAAGINRADLPENCVDKDFNIFKS